MTLEDLHLINTPQLHADERHGRKSGKWSKAQKRAYARIRAGLKMHQGERLRFMTLTTADGMKRPLNEAFRALKERIRRMRPVRLYKMGYLKKGDLRKYKDLNAPLQFVYFKVETSEGRKGVYHILFFGDYIPQKWLSDVWRELTGTAYIVDIRATRGRVRRVRRLAAYVVSQYVAGQCAYVRFSCARSWAFQGYVTAMKNLISDYGFERGIRYFEVLLERKELRLRDEVWIIESFKLVRKSIKQLELTCAYGVAK